MKAHCLSAPLHTSACRVWWVLHSFLLQPPTGLIRSNIMWQLMWKMLGSIVGYNKHRKFQNSINPHIFNHVKYLPYNTVHAKHRMNTGGFFQGTPISYRTNALSKNSYLMSYPPPWYVVLVLFSRYYYKILFWRIISILIGNYEVSIITS